MVRDSRTGTESVTISRGLGDGRQRTLVRTRDATTGREEQLEDLQGLQEVRMGAEEIVGEQIGVVSAPIYITMQCNVMSFRGPNHKTREGRRVSRSST